MGQTGSTIAVMPLYSRFECLNNAVSQHDIPDQSEGTKNIDCHTLNQKQKLKGTAHRHLHSSEDRQKTAETPGCRIYRTCAVISDASPTVCTSLCRRGRASCTVKSPYRVSLQVVIIMMSLLHSLFQHSLFGPWCMNCLPSQSVIHPHPIGLPGGLHKFTVKQEKSRQSEWNGLTSSCRYESVVIGRGFQGNQKSDRNPYEHFCIAPPSSTSSTLTMASLSGNFSRMKLTVPLTSNRSLDSIRITGIHREGVGGQRGESERETNPPKRY